MKEQIKGTCFVNIDIYMKKSNDSEVKEIIGANEPSSELKNDFFELRKIVEKPS